jgi:hypothetical protein
VGARYPRPTSSLPDTPRYPLSGDRKSGATHVLYDTTFSERGVLQCVGRQPRKANPFDFQIPMQVGTSLGLASGGVMAGCAAQQAGRHRQGNAPRPAPACWLRHLLPGMSTITTTACCLPMHMLPYQAPTCNRDIRRHAAECISLTHVLCPPQILAPHALPMYREAQPHKKRKLDKEAREARKPDLGAAAGVGKQGRIGTTGGTLLTQHLMKQKGKLVSVEEEADAREMILRHAGKTDAFNRFTDAYATTQPKPVFAQEEEEEEGEGEEGQ